jgi:enterochelin esterase family protein
MSSIQYNSPKINALAEQVIIGNTKSIDLFWQNIEREGTPLIETINGDKNNSLLTYVFKGEENTKNVIVMHPTCWKDYKDNTLSNIPGTNVWYKSYVIRNDVRGRYDFSVNDALDEDWAKRSSNIRHDVYNKNRIIFKGDEGEEDSIVSYFVMPNAEKPVWTVEKETVFKGSVEPHNIYLRELDKMRKIYVYKPYNYSQENTYKMLLLTDGDTYIDILSAPTVMDNLIAERVIEPMIVVLIDGGNNRNEELMCSETFANCITLDIMPWIKDNFNVSDRAEDVIIGGFSLGGLFAAFMGLHYPNVFGNVLSQSGSFYWSPNAPKEVNWIITKYKEAEKLPAKFFINVGVLENMEYPPFSSMIYINKKMRDILIEKKDCIVKYEEFKSGHDYLSWGETLANGLIALIGN